jgi:Uma2 family endonuclease
MPRLGKHDYTVADVLEMEKTGVLSASERVELLEGKLYTLIPPGKRHAACVNYLTAKFLQACSENAVVRVQRPVYLNRHTSPDPDIALLSLDGDFFEHAGNIPEEVLLMVEVSYTSLGHDLGRKLPVYARHGIPETWIINLQDNVVEVYLNPRQTGYQQRILYQPGEAVTLYAFPDIEIIPLAETTR